MRGITVSMFMSLDGVMQDPAWTRPYWNDVIQDFKFKELFAHDGLLLGRVTYEGFSQAWPSQKDEQGYADRINSFPKYVVTSTLTDSKWTNSTYIKSSVVDQIAKLKQQDGQDLLVFGSATLVQTLIQNDLVDHFNIQLYPVVLGKGKPLFQEGSSAKLKLVESTPTPSGVVLLRYDVAHAE